MDTNDFVDLKISLLDDSIVKVEVAINYIPPMGGYSQHMLANGTASNLKQNPEPQYILIKENEVYAPSSSGEKLIGILVE